MCYPTRQTKSNRLSNFYIFVIITTMLKIRLQRVGRKHEPKFRLVLTDSKNSTKSGKLLEILGHYDSRRGEDSVFKTDRVTYWMSVGAKATPTVHNLLVTKGIISGKKINVLPFKKPIIKKTEEEKEKKEEKTEENKEEEKETPEEAPAPEEKKEKEEIVAEGVV